MDEDIDTKRLLKFPMLFENLMGLTHKRVYDKEDATIIANM